jgi:anti-sigma factor RsiW
MTCRETVERIAAYLDQTLPAREYERVARHLAQCPHCAEYLAQIKATKDATGRLATDSLSPAAETELLELFRKARRP